MNSNRLDYLKSLAAKEYLAQKPGLGRISRILRLLGNPQDSYPVVHIAGTNGKGSTAKMIYEILRKAGYKAGLYTSPHLVCYRERIRSGARQDRLISDREVTGFLKVIFTADRKLYAELTYFELITAVAFMHFKREKVDCLVCEAGLGGKYDATNAVRKPEVSIITSVDYDHMEYLGAGLEDIAREKAGIIKARVPVIANLKRAEARRVISAKCRERGCRAFYLGRDFSRAYAGTDWKRWVQRFSYFGTDESRKGLTLGLLGRHQLDNASMALACVEVLAAAGKFRFSDFQIRQALKEARWPGRFDLVSTRPRIILDGAHNAHGAAALRETLSECPYAKKNLIIAMNILKGKEYRKICRILSRLPEKVVIFGINNSRALEPGILMNEWGKYLKPDRIEYAGNIAGVLKKIRKTDTLCVTGSLYAVGEALAFFGRSQ